VTFPATIRQVKVELQKTDLTWTDITTDVFGGDRDLIEIQYGKTDEASQTAPAMCTFSVQNLAGKYSMRYPTGALYGHLKRNTPVRVSVTDTGTDYRFHGELSSQRPRWDVSGNDAFVLFTAAGVLRRLGQGTEPAEAGLRAFTLAATGLKRYWPLSGAEGTTYSLDIAGTGSSHRFSGPVGQFTYGLDFGKVWLGTGMAYFNSNNGYMSADASVASDPYVAVDFVFQTAEMATIIYSFRDYNGALWSVEIDPDGDLSIAWLDPAGVSPTTVASASNVATFLDQQPHHIRLELLKSGADTTAAIYLDGVSIASGTLAGFTQAGVTKVQFGISRTGTQQYIVLGHVTVWSDASSASWPSAASTAQAAAGYVGEAAGVRIQRIGALAGQTVVVDGTASDTALMGPQFSEAKLTQLRDAETADMGILTEPRDQFGLLYRTHRSLYNQAAALTLQYDSNQLAPPFEPTDDDQFTRNDITAVRREGDSFRVQQTTGPLSVSDPPAGVGRYRDEVTVNVQTDEMVQSAAGWLLHMGTVDEARFTSIVVDLTNPNVVAAGLDVAVRAVSIGDRILIQDADAAFFPDDLSLIVLGYKEQIRQKMHLFTFNCAPASPYEVFTVESATSRISPGEVALVNASMTTTATTMQVLSSDASTLWTTAGGDMPIPVMVNGELMSVTAISGTTPGVQQTFTVTRSVNGVVKTHAVGETVRLNRRAVWAL
jgi:hypothetical protein